MRRILLCLAAAGSLFSFTSVFAEDNLISTPESVQTTFKPFTGKITRNKVRIRLKPSLEAPILKELSHEDMVIVVGDSEEFYAVKPPPDIKGYVFRTYVLDGVVEGNRVNVRLEPDTEAPIIGQLSSGDQVKGTISPLNSKWLEIDPPESTQFFICKEYVQNIGDPSLLAILCKRRDDVNEMLLTVTEQSQAELQKPFEEIRIDSAVATLNRIISQYSDFPQQVAQAKEQLGVIQDTFLQKKLAYLESKTQYLESHKQSSDEPQQVMIESNEDIESSSPWSSVEKTFYEEWMSRHPRTSLEDYYAQQKKEALVLKGTIEPYVRSVKNKPGDFILVSNTSKLPVAYLYSTRLDLNTMTGREVTITALPRPNNDFAFPAYFVLSVD